MSRVEIDIEGVANYTLDNLAPAMQAGALYLVGEIKGEISQPGTGQIYKRGSKTHRASAPGKAPASDTGRLLGAILPLNLRREGALVITGATANTDYAASLEFGTDKMAPRPFMESTLATRLSGFTQTVKANVS